MSDDFRRQTFDIIQQLTGDRNVVVIPRLFVTLLEGDYIAAAILNQIVYWTDHTIDPEGWFYKSYDEWTDETGLSKYQVSRSINGDKRVKGEKVTLASVGVETKRKKAPNGAPTIHYRINREVFIDALAHAVNPIVNNVDYANVNNVDDGKSTNSTIHSQQSQPSSYTENTTENTTKTPPPQKPAGKPREPNPMYDAVKDVFQLTGAMNTDMQKLLQGKATKKGYVEYNLDEPMDAPELREWGEWYRKTELKGDHALNMVRKPEKIQSSIGYWREQKRERAAKLAAAEAQQNAYLNGVKTQTSTASSHIQNPSAPPDDQTPMTPEQRAQAEALFANVVANLGGKQRVSA